MKKITKLSSKVLLVKLDIKKQTDSGIILPETLHTVRNGTIVMVGDEVKTFAVGDKIVLPKYSGSEPVTIGDESFVVVSEDVITFAYED